MLIHNQYSVILTDGEFICRIKFLNEELNRLEETLQRLFKIGVNAIADIRIALERFEVVHAEKCQTVAQLEELGLMGYDTR